MVEFMDLPLDIISLFFDELSRPKVTDRRYWFGDLRPHVIASRYFASPAKDPWADVAADDRLAMATLSRTCQQLHQTVEPFLYRYVNVQEVHPRRILSLVRHLSSRPDTAASIRVLHVGSLRVGQATHEEDQATYEEEDVAFFSDLSGRLGIGGFGRVLMMAGMWEGFLLFQARALSALDIYETGFQQFQCSYASQNDPSLPRLGSITHLLLQRASKPLDDHRCTSVGFPNLESVELAGFIDLTSSKDVKPPQIDWAKITSIDLLCSCYTATEIGHILATAKGIKEFRVDQLLESWERGPYCPFGELKRHAGTLKSLTWGVEDYPAPEAISGFGSLSAFTALEFLTLEAEAIADAAHDILTTLPKSLRRLAVKGYIGNHEEGFRALANQTTSGSLPNLKEVVIERWATHEAVFHDDDDDDMQYLRRHMGADFFHHVGPGEEKVDLVNGFERKSCGDCELGWRIYNMLSEVGLYVGVSISNYLDI